MEDNESESDIGEHSDIEADIVEEQELNNSSNQNQQRQEPNTSLNQNWQAN